MSVQTRPDPPRVKMVYNLLYGPYINSKGRRIVFIGSNWQEMKCISYARYRMSEHLGRELTENETVDHIDENKLNDCIENYQILTNGANTAKSKKYNAHPEKVVICCQCGRSFNVPYKIYNFKIKHNLPMPLCSKKCRSIKAGIKSGEVRRNRLTND